MIGEGLLLFGFGVGVVALALGLHVLVMYVSSSVQERSKKRAGTEPVAGDHGK
jgi:Na+-transporting methylmalonyl-CoA/oxaloacetate decarboxylase gamma subunit